MKLRLHIIGLIVLASAPVLGAPWNTSMHRTTRNNGLAVCNTILGGLPGARRRPCVIFDIDNTLVDTRARTRAAVNAFAVSRGLPRLADLPLAAMRYDGRQTARQLGLDRKVVDAFHREWGRFFWQGQSFRHDRPLRTTVQLARKAKAAGAEVFYLTGRVDSLKHHTVSQLRRLGLPDANPAHVICKPSLGQRTAPFKQRVVSELRHKRHVAWFMSDSRTDVAAVQRVLPAGRCVLVDFPVQPAGKPAPVHPATPVIRLGR